MSERATPPSSGARVFGSTGTLTWGNFRKSLFARLLAAFLVVSLPGNLAATRHVERVRRTLLQLARTYGHADREGIRIDFPISHALLAEMV